MNGSLKTPSSSDDEHTERLKRDYLERTLVLVESFARQTARYREQGDEQAALKAWTNVESFCRLAVEMIEKFQDEQEAASFMTRLKLVGCGRETLVA